MAIPIFVQRSDAKHDIRWSIINGLQHLISAHQRVLSNVSASTHGVESRAQRAFTKLAGPDLYVILVKTHALPSDAEASS